MSNGRHVTTITINDSFGRTEKIDRAMLPLVIQQSILERYVVMAGHMKWKAETLLLFTLNLDSIYSLG